MGCASTKPSVTGTKNTITRIVSQAEPFTWPSVSGTPRTPTPEKGAPDEPRDEHSELMDMIDVNIQTTQLEAEILQERAEHPESRTSAASSSANAQREIEPQITTDKLDYVTSTPLIDDEFTEMYAKLEQIFSECKNCNDVAAKHLAANLEKLERFKSIAQTRKDGLRDQWINKLCDLGVVSLWLKLWPKFWETNFTDGDGEAATNISMNFTYILRILWSATDTSERMCEQLCKSFGMDLILEKFDEDKLFSLDSLKKNHKRRYITSGLLSLIQNCLRLYSTAIRYFREANGPNIVQKFFKCDQMLIKTKCLLCLAYVANEQEIAAIACASANVKYLVCLMEKALDEPDHRYHGFSAIELMDALNHIAVNDSSKVRFVKCGLLPVTLALIRHPCSDIEMYAALKNAWLLSFADINKAKLKEQPGCVAMLEKLKKHPNSRIARAANGTLWLMSEALSRFRKESRANLLPMEGSNLPESSRIVHPGQSLLLPQPMQEISQPLVKTTESETGRIMLSYDWLHKPIVLKLRTELNRAGYATWMDVDQMSGSTLESMAKAVEQASVVLICLSERYRNSAACRTEAEYAFKLQKPIIPVRTELHYQPDSWLGALIGTQLIFECTCEAEVALVMGPLCKELGGRGKTLQGALDPENTIDRVESARLNAARPSGPVRTKYDVQEWTEAQVFVWLKEGGLENAIEKFKGFDGKRLLAMRTMYQRAPSSFYKMARKELTISLSQLLQLADLLENLCC